MNTRIPPCPDAEPGMPRGPYCAARNDAFGLTLRERCVLGLLQDGLSNRAIARHLFRSERTVEHHVSALFAKLGIASRKQLGSGAGDARAQSLTKSGYRPRAVGASAFAVAPKVGSCGPVNVSPAGTSSQTVTPLHQGNRS